MDISSTLEPKSDQLDAVDLLDGPRTFTIEKATKGNAEQPVNIHLKEFPRVWRPGKSMRRVLAAVLGKETDAWAGHRVTLYCDPTVKFGGVDVGGTRISHITGITEPKKVPLIVTRGKSAMWTVQPLREVEPASLPQPTDTIPKMLAAYERAGVTKAMLEAREGRSADEWDAGNVANLTALFEALKAGEKQKADEFPELSAGAEV